MPVIGVPESICKASGNGRQNNMPNNLKLKRQTDFRTVHPLTYRASFTLIEAGMGPATLLHVSSEVHQLHVRETRKHVPCTLILIARHPQDQTTSSSEFRRVTCFENILMSDPTHRVRTMGQASEVWDYVLGNLHPKAMYETHIRTRQGKELSKPGVQAISAPKTSCVVLKTFRIKRCMLNIAASHSKRAVTYGFEHILDATARVLQLLLTCEHKKSPPLASHPKSCEHMSSARSEHTAKDGFRRPWAWTSQQKSAKVPLALGSGGTQGMGWSQVAARTADLPGRGSPPL